MKIDGKAYHTIWADSPTEGVVSVIDQRKLPFAFEICRLKTVEDIWLAIGDMAVRGAPLIGVTGAYGIWLAVRESSDVNWKAELIRQANYLKNARPTAVNLAILIDEVVTNILTSPSKQAAETMAYTEAERVKQREIEWSEAIGEWGKGLISEISRKKNGEPVNILTHCNAGWLACIDWGTATAPIYKAHREGIPVHVWVDETRPRNQGARLTAWELAMENVPHTIIPDNSGGHLMQHGQIDLCIVGSDRTTRTGDVANKIGTYLKALAAHDNQIPFTVALPSSTIDFTMSNGIGEIPIEERNGEEVRWMEGETEAGVCSKFRIIPEQHAVANYGFDVTPARLVSGLITERGICNANAQSIKMLFPERE